MLTSKLLDSVFPDDGPLRVLEIVQPSGVRFVRWYEDNKNLLSAARHYSDSGANVYFSFSTFVEKDTRSLKNLADVRALGLDIDVREQGGQYNDFPTAAKALGAAIKAAKLPHPFINHSGGGLHVFWPLLEALPLQRWRPLQRALLLRLSEMGLKVDVGPSVNAVGLFRVPGTLNHKRRADVRVLHEGEPVLAEQLAEILGFDETATPAPASINLPKGFKVIDAMRAIDWSHLYAEKELAPILQGCAQMRAAPSGQEPFWRAGLAIVRLVRDGATKAHEWSASCPEKYNADAVDNKLSVLERQQGAIGLPTRCSTFDTLNPGVCKSCPHWGHINSPITLGRVSVEVETVEEPPVTQETEAPAPKSSVLSLRPFVHSAGAHLAFEQEDGFFISTNGTPCFREMVEDSDQAEIIEILPGKIGLVAHVIGKSSGEQANACVWDVSVDGEMKQIIVPMQDLGDTKDATKLAAAFARHSIIFTTAKKRNLFSRFLRTYFLQCRAKLPKIDRTEHFGWTDRGFVTPNTQYRFDGTYSAPHLQGNAAARSSRFGNAGSLEAWLDVPRIYKEQGSLEAQFAILQAFASPLVRDSGQQGLLVHLYSQESGSGKSTLLKAINSVWGDAEKLMLTRHDTANSHGLIFTAHQNIPVTIDEITNAAGSWVGDLAFGITQGTQKQRATKDAGLRDPGQWCLLAVTSGNESIRDQLAKNRRTDAEAENARCIEVRMSAPPVDPEIAGRLADAMRFGAGAAGEIYAKWLVSNRAHIRPMVERAKAKWTSIVGASTSERFWVASAAVTEVAFELSKVAGLHEFEWEPLETWIRTVLLPKQRQQLKAANEIQDNDCLSAIDNEVAPNTVVFTRSGETMNLVRQPSGNALIVARREEEPDGSATLYISVKAIRDWATKHDKSLTPIREALKSSPMYAGMTKKRLAAGVTGLASVSALDVMVFRVSSNEGVDKK